MPNFEYDPHTGVVCKDGAAWGTVNTAGYLVGRYEGKVVYAHRLAWFLHHGHWPPCRLDHENGDRQDNRIDNLRPATSGQNAQNRTRFKVAGAYLHKATGKYKSAIYFQGRQVHLGYFNTAEEASEMYLAVKARLHTFWSGHAQVE